MNKSTWEPASGLPAELMERFDQGLPTSDVDGDDDSDSSDSASDATSDHATEAEKDAEEQSEVQQAELIDKQS